MTVDSRGCHCLSVVVGPWCGRRMEVNCPGFGLVQRVTDQPCGFVIASIASALDEEEEEEPEIGTRSVSAARSRVLQYSI
jgi:hypothetical protein